MIYHSNMPKLKILIILSNTLPSSTLIF